MDVNVPTLTVGATTEVSDGEVALDTDSAALFMGATKQWRLSIATDGDGDHFVVSHFDTVTSTYVSKMDVLA